MTKTTVKLYACSVSMDEEMRTYLLSCYRNHLAVYNNVIDLMRKHKYQTYKEVKVALAKMLEEFKIAPVIKNALSNEIYYLFKKADFKHKSITDIQYLSAVTDNTYKNHTLVYHQDSCEISVPGFDKRIKLDKPLPALTGYETAYINLSYSCGEDSFELSVFATQDTEQSCLAEFNHL